MFWSRSSSQDEALDVASEWIAFISKHREHWDEWMPLMEMLSGDEYSLKKHPAKSNMCLVGSRTRRKKRRVVYEPRYLGYNDALPLGLPGFMIALYGLRMSPAYSRKGDMCRSHGGIGELIHMRETPRELALKNSKWLARGAGVLYALDLDFPENVSFFTQGSTGRLFFINDDHQILVYSREQGRLKVIGKLGNFVRYCLYFFLDESDWYMDGYARDYNTEYFDLIYYA